MDRRRFLRRTGAVAGIAGAAWVTPSVLAAPAASASPVGAPRWVAVGGNGVILTRTGATWAVSPSGTTQQLEAVAHNGGSTWVVVGAGVILRSTTDLASWDPPVAIAASFTGVVYGAGIWVAVDLAGNVRTSTDGTTWPIATTLPKALYGVVFDGGVFTTVGVDGSIWSSSTGSTWGSPEVSNTTENLYAVAARAGSRTAVGDFGWVTSTTGSTWTAEDIGNFTRLLGVAASPGGIRVAVGYTGSGPSGAYSYSNDGVNWSALATLGGIIEAVAHDGASEFVMVGRGGAIRSSGTGAAWTNQSSGTTQPLYGVAHSI